MSTFFSYYIKCVSPSLLRFHVDILLPVTAVWTWMPAISVLILHQQKPIFSFRYGWTFKTHSLVIVWHFIYKHFILMSAIFTLYRKAANQNNQPLLFSDNPVRSYYFFMSPTSDVLKDTNIQSEETCLILFWSSERQATTEMKWSSPVAPRQLWSTTGAQAQPLMLLKQFCSDCLSQGLYFLVSFMCVWVYLFLA